MPISDEIIELAPVKKTKKVFILLSAVAGVCFALAVAFLALYFAKPSVSENTKVVVGVTASSNELFSEMVDGKATKFASIGNEYKLTSRASVENGASPDIQWEWPRDALEVLKTFPGDSENDAYIKFIPRIGFHNTTVRVVARSQSNINKSEEIEFTIINQGAEYLKITSYETSSTTTSSAATFKISDALPYNNVITIQNIPLYSNKLANKTYRVRFEQLGKYHAELGKHANLTHVKSGNGTTGDISVSVDNPDIIVINGKNVQPLPDKNSENSDQIQKVEKITGSFEFTANRVGEVNVVITANGSNPECTQITRTIKIKVESSASLGYAETVYFFNKPIVDVDFIKSIADNAGALDKTKLDNKLKADPTLKCSQASAKNASLVLPYSVEYDRIFQHVLVSPLNIQCKFDNKNVVTEIKEDWFKGKFAVETTNKTALAVTTNSTTGNVALKGSRLASKTAAPASQCSINIFDKQEGSLGANVEVPVDIIACTRSLTATIKIGATEYKETDNVIEVASSANSVYELILKYEYVASGKDDPASFIESGLVNNAYKFVFSANEIDVTVKGETEKKISGDSYNFKTTEVEKVTAGATDLITKYTAIARFTVTVKATTDGVHEIKYIKSGATIFGDDKQIQSGDFPFEKSIKFNITRLATSADIVSTKDGTDIITESGRLAGRFVRVNNTDANVYIQNKANGTTVDKLNPDNIKSLITVNGNLSFNVSLSASTNTGLKTSSSAPGVLIFTGDSVDPNARIATLTVVVKDAVDKEIGKLYFNVYLIDVINGFSAITGTLVGSYGYEGKNSGLENGYVTIDTSKVKVYKEFNTTPIQYDFKGVNLYYGNENKSTALIGDKIDTNITKFKYKSGTEEQYLYSYDSSTKRITPLTDIYYYSSQKNIDFSKIYVEFLLKDDDEYVGKASRRAFANNSRQTCVFERRSDGVELYSDSTFASDKKIQSDSSGNFIYDVHQGGTARVYVGSVLHLNGEATNKITINLHDAHPAAVKYAYITVPDKINEKITNKDNKIENKLNSYCHIEFTGPDVNQSTGVDDYTLNVFYDGGEERKDLLLTVSNATRASTEIKFYGSQKTSGREMDGSSTIESALFGKLNYNKDPFFDILYLKVTYADVNTRYTHFEPIELTLPQYMILTLNNNIDERIVKKSDSQNTYILTSLVSNIKRNDKSVQTWSDTFTLPLTIADSIEVDGVSKKIGEIYGSSNDKIYVVSTQNVNGERRKAQCNIVIDTGLDSIVATYGSGTTDKVTIGAGDDKTGTINYTLNIKSASDKPYVDIALAYNPLSDYATYKIPYKYCGDRGNLQFTDADAPTGIYINNYVSNESNSGIRIGVADNAKTMPKTTLTFTFKDKAGAADGATLVTFTLKINITVTVDIYDIGLTGDFNFVTNGKNDNTYVLPHDINVVFNNGAANLQPSDDQKDGITLKIVKKASDGSYTDVADSIAKIEKKSSGKYELKVSNSALRSDSYYVRVTYGTTLADEKPISITTTAVGVRLVSSGNTIAVDGGCNASIEISAGDTRTLKAEVYNLGSNQVDSSKTVTYAIDGDSAAAGYITIDTAGIIHINSVKDASGTINYTASYTDSGTSTKVELKVTISYKVKLSDVSIVGIDNTLFGNTITLYYTDPSNYTYIDIASHLQATTTFGSISFSSTATPGIATFEISKTSTAIDVVGNYIKPSGLTAGAILTVKATYGNSVVTKNYTVRVIGAPTLTLNAITGSIDMLQNNSVNILASSAIAPVTGFTADFTVECQSSADGDLIGLAKQAGKNEYVVMLNGKSNAHLKTYTLIATAKYANTKNAGASASLLGSIESKVTYTLTVDCTYAPDFALKHGTDTLFVSSVATHYLVNNPTGYTIEVGNKTHEDTAAAYSAEVTAGAGIVTIGGFDASGVATVGVNANASGEFTVKLTATVYGKAFDVSKTYKFAYGADPTVAIYGSENNGAFGALSDNQNVDIGYTANKYRVKYVIKNITKPEVGAGDITITASHGVIGSVTDDAEGYAVIITVDQPGKLHIGGTVKVGNRIVYLTTKSVDLTATAPAFAINGSSESIVSGNALTLSVNAATGFKGDTSVVYELDTASNEYATLSGTTLTAKANISTDKTVKVKATVTVSNGVYKGTYHIEKYFTIYGVALPVVSWNDNAPRTIAVGGSHNYVDKYTINKNVTLSTDGRYDFTGKTGTAITASAVNLVSGTDYTFSGYTLTVNDTAKTKAGGKITLTITETVNSGARNGEKVTSTIDVIIVPTALNVQNITVPNAKGIVDFNAHKTEIKPYFLDNNGDSFVKSTDTYNIVNVALSGTNDNAAFSATGNKLELLKNIVAQNTTATVTVTAVISSGAYKGYTLTGNVTVNVTVPTKATKQVTFGTNAYNTVTADMTGAGISGTVSSIYVFVTDSNAGFVDISANGGIAPTISVKKSFNAYLNGTSAPAAKAISLGYTVTMSDGKVYYREAELRADAVAVTVTAKSGDTSSSDTDSTSNVISSGATITKDPGEKVILYFTADKGFAVAIRSGADGVTVDKTDVVFAEKGSNSIIFTTANVSSSQTASITIKLDVEGNSNAYTFNFSITVVPLTTNKYVPQNTLFTEFAVGNSGNSQSMWEKKDTYSYYSFFYKLVVTAPTGNVSKYFKSLSLKGLTSATNGTAQPEVTISGNTLNNPSCTLFFNNGANTHVTSYSGGFTFEFIVNTDNAIPATDIRVEFITYMGSGNRAAWVSIVYNYTVRVVADVTVTLDTNADGDSVTLPSGITDNKVTVKYKDNYALPTSENVSRTGYTFKGWYTSPVGGESVTNSTAMTNTANHTLYARWQANKYTITFKNNHSSADNTNAGTLSDITYGKAIGGTFPNPTSSLAGHTFAGWYTGQTGGVVVTSDTIMKGDVHTTLYAHWTPNVYTLTFYGNRSTSDNNTSIGQIQLVYGTSCALPAPPAATAGYEFDGWYTATTGGEKLGSTNTIADDTSYYAHWKKIAYSITFELNGGHFVGGDSPACTATIGGNYSSLPVAENVAFAGHTFDGWYTQPVGGTQITTTTTYALTNGTVLYAHWTEQTHTVTFALAGGTLNGQSSFSVTVKHNERFNLHTILVPTRDNHTFGGWKKGETIQTSAFQVTGDVTLTATWREVYTVSFDLDYEGAVTLQAKYYYSGDRYNHSTKETASALPTPERAGYVFKGWSADNGTTFIDGESSTVTTNVTLKAQWNQILTLVFTANNTEYTTAIATGRCLRGERYNYYGNLPVLSDTATKKFDGWAYSGTLVTGTDNVPENVTVTDNSVTLVARWVDIYTVSFDLDYAGAATIAARKYVQGDTYGNSTYETAAALPTPTRDGHTFEGWYIDETTRVYDATQVTGNVTLKAHWVTKI